MDLQGSAFPIIFKICVAPTFDEKALNNMGYRMFNQYFRVSTLCDNVIFLSLFCRESLHTTPQWLVGEVTFLGAGSRLVSKMYLTVSGLILQRR